MYYIMTDRKMWPITNTDNGLNQPSIELDSKLVKMKHVIQKSFFFHLFRTRFVLGIFRWWHHRDLWTSWCRTKHRRHQKILNVQPSTLRFCCEHDRQPHTKQSVSRDTWRISLHECNYNSFFLLYKLCISHSAHIGRLRLISAVLG